MEAGCPEPVRVSESGNAVLQLPLTNSEQHSRAIYSRTVSPESQKLGS